MTPIRRALHHRLPALLLFALAAPPAPTEARKPPPPPTPPAAPTVAPTVSPDTRAAIRTLIGDILLNGQAYEYDRQLADTIGPRLTGSPIYMRAAGWAEQHLRDLGLSNVHTELWTIPATWEPESASGRILTPVDHALHLYSIGWSPSTPAAGVRGPVLYLPALTAGALDALASSIKGSVALVDDKTFGDKPSLEQLFSGLDRLRALHPAAILYPGGANGTETLTSLNFSGAIDPIPEAEIGAEDVALLKRLLDSASEHDQARPDHEPAQSSARPNHPQEQSSARPLHKSEPGQEHEQDQAAHAAPGQPVTVQLTLTNRIRTDVPVPNVVAEIPGSDPALKDSIVLIGAHLDSWNPGTGAQDNGTGVATVLEAARAIKALPHPPRRTLRFVLFGGEEEGLLGSTAYARAHRPDLARIDAVLISDTGAQPARGWYLMGREDEKAALKNVSPLLAGLGADSTNDSTEFVFETDHAAFDVLGVPTLVLWTDTDLYFKLHHKASDTFDSVSERDLNQGAAVTTTTAYALADSPQPFAPHLSPAEVQTFLKKSGNLDEYLYLKQVNALP